jgi:hypothetical protein
MALDKNAVRIFVKLKKNASRSVIEETLGIRLGPPLVPGVFMVLVTPARVQTLHV